MTAAWGTGVAAALPPEGVAAAGAWVASSAIAVASGAAVGAGADVA